MGDQKISRWGRAKSIWSGYGQADTALSFLDRTGLSRIVLPMLMSGAFTLASVFTDWAEAFGPLGILSVAVGGFIIGCVSLIGIETLRTKRTERLRVQSERPQKNPEFGLRLRGGNTFNPGESQQIACINAAVLIWNTGDPTYIVEWSMEISVGEVTYAGQYTEPNRDGMRDAETGRTTIKWEESFEAKRGAIGEEPIACDVLFVFKAPIPNLIGPQAIWRISFSDIYGNVCSADYRPSGGITSKDLKV